MKGIAKTLGVLGSNSGIGVGMSCEACKNTRVKLGLLYCEDCSEELARELTRLIGKPFDDLAFWDHIKKSSN